METVCPLCNGLQIVTISCPLCGAVMQDGGTIESFSGGSRYCVLHTFAFLSVLSL